MATTTCSTGRVHASPGLPCWKIANWPSELPAELAQEGFVPDLRDAIAGLIGFQGQEDGTAVIIDRDIVRLDMTPSR